MLRARAWRLDAVLLLISGLLLSGFVGGIMYRGLQVLKIIKETDRFLQFIVGTVSLHVVALFLIGFLIREQDMTWNSTFGFRQRPGMRAVALGALVGVIVLPITWYLNQLSFFVLSRFQIQPLVQPAVESFKATVSGAEQVIFGVLTVLVAPAVEEILFRGVFYPALLQRMRRGLALWGGAILFAAIHQSDVTFLPLTFLAVVLTLLYEETGNLLAPIVVHCLFNLANLFWLIAERHAIL